MSANTYRTFKTTISEGNSYGTMKVKWTFTCPLEDVLAERKETKQ